MSDALTVDEARDRMLADAEPGPSETLDLALAAGRILAAPISADRTQPPFPSAAMDGYAVRDADVRATPARLRVIGEAPAGRPFAGTVGAGEAVRIFTGGVVPAGADRVVIQEDTARDGDSVTVTEAPTGADHVRRAGRDFSAGQLLLRPGMRLEGSALALAASANAARVQTHRPPIVGVLATGDELVEPGGAPGPAQIISSTPYALVERIAAWGGQPAALGIAGDSEASIIEAADMPGIDILVPIGGASVGEHDLVKPALAQRGLVTAFERVKMKPGKPTWFGTLGEQLVLGVPGNPASALVAAHLFLKPLIHALTGRDPAAAVHMFSARLTADLPSVGPRETYLRAHLGVNAIGALTARAMGDQDSSLLTPFAQANALIQRPAGASAAAAGDVTQVLPLFDGM